MEIDLIKAWVNMNAPESIKEDLIEGAIMLMMSRRWQKNRREKFPNEGNVFTDSESARIIELDSYLSNSTCSLERDREIEQEFGRTLKSVKGRLRRMKLKN